MAYTDITDQLFAGGEIVGALKNGINLALLNIVDTNTDPLKRREITLRVGITGNAARDSASIDVSVASRLETPQVVFDDLSLVLPPPAE